MKQSVRDAFLSFTVPLEGVVRWPYRDLKNLVSIGIGNLIDPVDLALDLPLMKPDGTRASSDEIRAAWAAVKGLPGSGLGYKAFEHVTDLRLTDTGIHDLVFGKLDQNEKVLLNHFMGFDGWPADAQLATLSMAWACGPFFWHTWPKLNAALITCDFRTAATECFMPEEKTFGGLRPRNTANRNLYLNAAHVFTDPALSPETLYWPRYLEDEAPTEPSPA